MKEEKSISEAFKELREAVKGGFWDNCICVCRELDKSACELNCKEYHNHSLPNSLTNVQVSGTIEADSSNAAKSTNSDLLKDFHKELDKEAERVASSDYVKEKEFGKWEQEYEKFCYCANWSYSYLLPIIRAQENHIEELKEVIKKSMAYEGELKMEIGEYDKEAGEYKELMQKLQQEINDLNHENKVLLTMQQRVNNTCEELQEENNNLKNK